VSILLDAGDLRSWIGAGLGDPRTTCMESPRRADFASPKFFIFVVRPYPGEFAPLRAGNLLCGRGLRRCGGAIFARLRLGGGTVFARLGRFFNRASAAVSILESARIAERGQVISERGQILLQGAKFSDGERCEFSERGQVPSKGPSFSVSPRLAAAEKRQPSARRAPVAQLLAVQDG
jgi:hypothetical protein